MTHHGALNVVWIIFVCVLHPIDASGAGQNLTIPAPSQTNCTGEAHLPELSALFFDEQCLRELPIECPVQNVNAFMDLMLGDLRFEAQFLGFLGLLAMISLMQLGGIPLRNSYLSKCAWFMVLAVFWMQAACELLSFFSIVFAYSSLSATVHSCMVPFGETDFKLLNVIVLPSFLVQPSMLMRIVRMLVLIAWGTTDILRIDGKGNIASAPDSTMSFILIPSPLIFPVLSFFLSLACLFWILLSPMCMFQVLLHTILFKCLQVLQRFGKARQGCWETLNQALSWVDQDDPNIKSLARILLSLTVFTSMIYGFALAAYAYSGQTPEDNMMLVRFLYEHVFQALTTFTMAFPHSMEFDLTWLEELDVETLLSALADPLEFDCTYWIESSRTVLALSTLIAMLKPAISFVLVASQAVLKLEPQQIPFSTVSTNLEGGRLSEIMDKPTSSSGDDNDSGDQA